VIGRLPCAGGENPRAHGIRQLLWELMKRTSVEAELESVAAEPGSASLFRTPLLLWSCEGPAAPLDPDAAANLRRFLALGGFMLVDDPSAQPGGPFDLSVRAALKQVLPERELKPLPFSHVLFKTFFLLGSLGGRRLAREQLEGIFLGDRLAVVVSANDLLGATSRDFYGSFEFLCEPGGEVQRETAFRLGINIIYFALCLDYKDDRVHLPFILKRRRL
jgi:hypothetical protein